MLEGKIYVSGGFVDDVGFTDAVERYDPVSDTWDTVSSLVRDTVFIMYCVYSDGYVHVWQSVIQG